MSKVSIKNLKVSEVYGFVSGPICFIGCIYKIETLKGVEFINVIDEHERKYFIPLKDIDEVNTIENYPEEARQLLIGRASICNKEAEIEDKIKELENELSTLKFPFKWFEDRMDEAKGILTRKYAKEIAESLVK